jgi:hypothetical protein
MLDHLSESGRKRKRIVIPAKAGIYWQLSFRPKVRNLFLAPFDKEGATGDFN